MEEKRKKFSYSEYYKAKIRSKPAQPPTHQPLPIINSSEKMAFKVKEEIEKDYKKTFNFFTLPKHIKILKIVITIIILLIIGFLLYKNFVSAEEFNYFYKAGGKTNYLSPLSRISSPATADGVNYINLTSSLVYFTAPIPRGSETIKVQVRFKDNFPLPIFSLGAKDKQEWHYKWNDLYKNSTKDKNNWSITETNFNLKDLYIKDNKLSMVFNIPHLSKDQYKNQTIQLDWINITIYKPGANISNILK